MPPPALAPPGAASRSVWGMEIEESEFPRSAPSVPPRHRSPGVSNVAGSEVFSPFGVGNAVARRKKRTNESDGDTTCGVLRTFRGNPLAPFSTPQTAEGNVYDSDQESQFPSDNGCLEKSVFLSGADSAGLASSANIPLQRLADLVSIPVGSLLLGVIAEIHSDDMLVHLPDGMVGWIPRAHAVLLLEDQPGRNDAEQGQNGGKSAKRCRKNSASGIVAAGESGALPRLAGGNEDHVSWGNITEVAVTQERALTRLAGHTKRRRIALTDHYAVGQIVQCVVIAEGEDEWQQQMPDCLRSRRAQILTLSLRPSLFNAGITVEAVQPGMVLPASLSSVEDHGYSFSLGINGISAFLPSTALQQCFCPVKIKRPFTSLTLKTTPKMSSSSPVSLPMNSIVSLRVDSVNVAAKVLLCSLPGTNETGKNSLDSKKQLSRRQGEPYLDLSKHVAWAAIKPGCLMEARVQQLHTLGNIAEKSTNEAISAKHRAGKKLLSLSNSGKSVNEKIVHDIRDVTGVRVVCLGGTTSGTLLQPHFGHPLLLHFERDGSSDVSQTHAEERGRGGGRKQNEQSEEGRSEGEQNSSNDAENHSENNDTVEAGFLSNPCSRILNCSNRKRKLRKEAGQILSGMAGDGTFASSRFKIIEERYYKGCLSKITRVGVRIIARVTCVLSSTRRHVYLSMLPHIMMWRPCSLPCSVPELLPGRSLVGATAHIISVFPSVTALPSKNLALKKKGSSSTSHGSTGDGDVRVLLLRKKIDGTGAQQRSRRLGAQMRKEKTQRSWCTENAGDTSHSHDVNENSVTCDSDYATEDSGKQTAGCELTGTESSGTAQDEVSREEEGQSCGWILVRIPGCMMATSRENSSFSGGRKSGTKKRAEPKTIIKIEKIPLTDLVPGDILWSASEESANGDCFCRVLYFDRFAAEVVGGNSARLLKRSVVLTPFDVAPGQIITVSVLRWRLPVECQSSKQQKRDEPLQSPSAGIFVKLSPYLSAFVPLHQLMDTPVSSFPPHVVPGSSLRLRVLERVCCRSCTDLDRDAMFAPFLRKGRHNFAAHFGSSGLSALPQQNLAGTYTDGLTYGSAVMGIGGGGGGRLMLTGKKSFLKDPHPLTSMVTPEAFHGRLGDAQRCCLPLDVIITGYVQEVYHRRASEGANYGRKKVEQDEKVLPFITVGFYNGLTARLSEDEVRRAIVEEGRTLKLGTVVKVRVLGVDTRYRCLCVTLDLSSEAFHTAMTATRRKEEKIALRLSPGGLVEKERLTLLALADEGVIVAVEGKREGEETCASLSATNAPISWHTPTVADGLHVGKSQYSYGSQHPHVVGLGFIPKMHLSDGVRLAEELYSVLQVGEKFPLDAVVVSSTATVRPGAPVRIWEMHEASVDEGASQRETRDVEFEGGLKGALARVKQALQQRAASDTDGSQGEHALEALLRDIVILSCKRTLRASAANGTFLRDCESVEKLKTKLRSSPPILWGFVRKIGSYGLLISFGAWQLTGLVPYSNISDTFIEDENHLRRLYREGMTVRGCIVAVNNAADEDTGQGHASGGNDDNRTVGSRGKRSGLRFLVDIRPKRLNYLQRHQRLEGDARAAASIGIQVLRGLFEDRHLAATLKHLKSPNELVCPLSTVKYDERSPKAIVNDSGGQDRVVIKEANSALESACDSTSLESRDKNISVAYLRPGQLVCGRILAQDFPNCVLLELQSPCLSREEKKSVCNKRCFSTFGNVMGVVLEHQLPEGETILSLQARARKGLHESQILCIVLDFDPVTGIADVSCRRRLVSPLQAAHNAIEEAARCPENKYVHYVLLGVSTSASSEPVSSELIEDCKGAAQMPETLRGVPGITDHSTCVRKRRIEVVTQELDSLLQRGTASFANQSASTSFSLDLADATSADARGMEVQQKTSEVTNETSSFRVVEAVPEKVIRRAQSFCGAQPAPCAIVQLENAAYCVLSADFDVILCFSGSKRLGQKQLDVFSSYAASCDKSSGGTAKPLRILPSGSITMCKSRIGRSSYASGSGNGADGLYFRLPLLLFSNSCHNNTLLPVQPAAKALQEAPEDAGWHVALSPIQRSFYLQRGAFDVAVLLAGGCWPMREHKLDQQSQRDSKAPSQRHGRTEEIGGVDRKTNTAESRKNKTLTEKVSASQLDDVIERAAAPGQILRARVTHIGACVALARLKTPKQELLIRLHAADALPPQLMQAVQATADSGDAFLKVKKSGRMLGQGENSDPMSSIDRKETSQPVVSGDESREPTYTGEEQSREKSIERTSWFPPAASQCTASRERSTFSWRRSNPLKRLTSGMLIDVKVLRLREVHTFSGGKIANLDPSVAAGGLQAAADGGQRISDEENRKGVQGDESVQEVGTAQSTKNQWVADVELVGWMEKRKTHGNSGRIHYFYVSNSASPSLTNCHADDVDRDSTKKSLLESGVAKSRTAWLYLPRWAVVEAVCDRYLTVHCGVRSGVQILRTNSEWRGLKNYFLSSDSDACALASLSGRGRVHRLDASRERRVLQNLKVYFAPGDMVCVRLLPIISLEEDAFEELVKSTTRAAACADEELTREGSAIPNKQLSFKKARRIAPLKARYTLVTCATGMAENLSPKTAQTGIQSHSATSVIPFETVPLSLVQTTFQTVADALDAWARWRYIPGMVCWGVVHHLLPPPFAVAVQMCEVVIKDSLLKSSSLTSSGKDSGRLDEQEVAEQTSGMERVFLNRTMEPVVHLPILAAVHVTEVTDTWQSDPVQHLKLSVGQLVKVCIIPVVKTEHAQQQLKYRKTESRSGLPLEASMRMSVVDEMCRRNARTGENENRLLTYDQLKVGDHVSGFVISTGNAGVFVAVSRYLTLRIKLQNLRSSASSPRKRPEKSQSNDSGIITGAQAKELYPVGKVLRGVRIIELHPDSRRVEGTLRDHILRSSKRGSITNEEHTPANKRPKNEAAMDVSHVSSIHEPPTDTLSCRFEVGDICEGRVKAIEPFGVFVRLLSPRTRHVTNEEENATDALCHISNIGGTTEEERRSTLEKLKVGDLVKARVTKKDHVTGRVWISLDSSVFESENSEGELEGVQSEVVPQEFGSHCAVKDGEFIGDQFDEGKKRTSVTAAQKGSCKDIMYPYGLEEASWTWSSAICGTEAVNDEGGEAGGDRSAESEDAVTSHGESGSHVSGRELTGINMSENVYIVQDAAVEVQKRRDRDDQRREKEEEARLFEEENSYRSWMENPRTPEDFEKLVLVSGNSAAVWINYMAYYVKLGDLARARQVAERAVVHINYREEQQRFDVWVAYLNMECTYGDAVETIFKRAIQYNDAKKIYYQMTFIYEKAQKLADARSACENCCARFPESQKMWIRHLTLLYGSAKDVPAARELMLQALLRLPRRKHVAFAACCARLEYKFGSKERGQTYFEKLLAEHPKRTDLWSQYMDAHICAHTPPRCQPADLQSVRLLFERASSLHLKPRKMKFFFTRWLVFEKRHGTVDSQSFVRERAREYVQAMETRLAEQQES